MRLNTCTACLFCSHLRKGLVRPSCSLNGHHQQTINKLKTAFQKYAYIFEELSIIFFNYLDFNFNFLFNSGIGGLRRNWRHSDLKRKKRINHNFTWTLQNCLDRTSFSSMWIFKCERRVEYLAKLVLQMLHSCEHSPLCVHIWSVRLYFRAKLFLQTVHSCWRTFVWTSSTCLLRVDTCRNCFLHMLHPCGMSPVCNKRWAFSEDNAL